MRSTCGSSRGTHGGENVSSWCVRCLHRRRSATLQGVLVSVPVCFIPSCLNSLCGLVNGRFPGITLAYSLRSKKYLDHTGNARHRNCFFEFCVLALWLFFLLLHKQCMLIKKKKKCKRINKQYLSFHATRCLGM